MSSPPLVLVNGYAATGADWDPTLLETLERDFAVHCPGNRGFGGPELGGEPLTMALMAEELVAFLDSCGLERIALAGWSMGGFLAQELAARHPDRVERLILLATDAGGPGAIRADPEVTARLFDHGGTPREQAGRLIGLLFPEPVAEEIDSRFGEVVAEARAALSPQALTAQEEAFGTWYAEPAEARLAAIAAPTLVMAGELDVVIPTENSAALAASIATARLETFPAAGHGFIAQEAPGVATSIGEFLGVG